MPVRPSIRIKSVWIFAHLPDSNRFEYLTIAGSTDVDPYLVLSINAEFECW